jgi:hypothetical protein
MPRMCAKRAASTGAAAPDGGGVVSSMLQSCEPRRAYMRGARLTARNWKRTERGCGMRWPRSLDAIPRKVNGTATADDDPRGRREDGAKSKRERGGAVY